MKESEIQKIKALVADANNNFADHVFQDKVNSVHLKKIKDNIEAIEQICEMSMEKNCVAASRRSRLPESSKKDLLKIAYAMSRFDSPIISEITGGECNQTEAFAYLERVTGVKATTLKNMRDRFDPYIEQVRSNRKGWHQVPLQLEYEEVKNYYADKDETFVARDITSILELM